MSADPHAFSRYMLAQSEKREASAQLNYASVELENKQIRERLAEIESQYEPLAKLTGGDERVRRLCLAAAFYVVVGRFPADVHGGVQ